MADVRLQAVHGQYDATLAAQQPTQALRVGRGQSAEFVVAVQQVGYGAWCDSDASACHFLVYFRNALVFGVAETANGGDDIETELVVWENEVWLGLGTVRFVEAFTEGIRAAADM